MSTSDVQDRTAYKSFLATFDQHIAPRVGENRSGGFRKILEAAEQHALTARKPILIVETGGLRKLDHWKGDGQSTRIFDAFVAYHNGYLFSVDINPLCAVLTREVCTHRSLAVTGDSVQFLKAFPGKQAISVLYLDSFDLDVRNPAPSNTHHMNELMAVVESLEPGTVVAVDDNLIVDGQPVGKGQLVGQFLSSRGVPLLFDGYQKVWQMP
jgi:hypothetical protein